MKCIQVIISMIFKKIIITHPGKKTSIASLTHVQNSQRLWIIHKKSKLSQNIWRIYTFPITFLLHLGWLDTFRSAARPEGMRKRSKVSVWKRKVKLYITADTHTMSSRTARACGQVSVVVSGGSGVLALGVGGCVWASVSARRWRGGPLSVTGLSPLSLSGTNPSLFKFRSEYGQLTALTMGERLVCIWIRILSCVCNNTCITYV